MMVKPGVLLNDKTDSFAKERNHKGSKGYKLSRIAAAARKADEELKSCDFERTGNR